MSHISFSELKNWEKCPFYHKLTYIDKIKVFQGNEHTAFGTAMHTVCENILTVGLDNPQKSFDEFFLTELRKIQDVTDLNGKLLADMRVQGKELAPMVKSAVEDYFGTDYEVVAVEEKLYEDIEGIKNIKFKGFIDLVLKTNDGQYHVIDWKTCGWGWNARRKAEKMTVYQLIFYKHFYSIKYNINPENITVHFGLLKRTGKKNRIELFKTTSGEKRSENALKLLYQAVYNILAKNYTKNRMACTTCEFKNTKHCP
jgi:RecB family exonuclease